MAHTSSKLTKQKSREHKTLGLLPPCGGASEPVKNGFKTKPYLNHKSCPANPIQGVHPEAGRVELNTDEADAIIMQFFVIIARIKAN